MLKRKFFLCLAPTDSQNAIETFELWDKGHEEIARYLTFGDWLELSVSDRWHDPGEIFSRVNSEGTPDLVAEQKSWPESLRAHQIRRLAGCPRSTALSKVLDELWVEPHPFVRLAAAQVHRVAEDDGSRIAELTESDEPSVALSARATLRASGWPHSLREMPTLRTCRTFWSGPPDRTCRSRTIARRCESVVRARDTLPRSPTLRATAGSSATPSATPSPRARSTWSTPVARVDAVGNSWNGSATGTTVEMKRRGGASTWD